MANPCPWVVFPQELKPGVQQAALPQQQGSKQSSPLQQGWRLSYTAAGQYRKVTVAVLASTTGSNQAPVLSVRSD